MYRVHHFFNIISSWGIQVHVCVTDFQMWYSPGRDFKRRKKLSIKIETYNLKIIFIGQVEFRNNIKILDWKNRFWNTKKRVCVSKILDSNYKNIIEKNVENVRSAWEISIIDYFVSMNITSAAKQCFLNFRLKFQPPPELKLFHAIFLRFTGYTLLKLSILSRQTTSKHFTI